jgi:hypothetical protein
VTSRGSPTASNSSASDVEAQNREETKEEETSTEPYLEDVPGNGPGVLSPSPRRNPVTRRSVGPTTDVKDLDDTGKWGSITKKEKVVVASFGGLILVAIVVAVGVMVAGKSNTSGSGASPESSENMNSTASLPPTAAPAAFETADDKYASLLGMLNGNPLTLNATLNLPGFLRELDSINDAAQHDPAVKAAKWVIQVDTANLVVDQLRDRFALASIYYGNNGENWLENDGWLSSDHVCKWGGEGNEQVKCTIDAESGLEVVNELDLSSNNLTGTVQSTMALVTSLKGIWLRENGLSGKIPGEVFGSLPKLIILYLQDNNFQGEIPASLLNSGSLGTWTRCCMRSFGTDFSPSVTCHAASTPSQPQGRCT